MSRNWYFLSLGLFALGLMAKPMLVTLPFVLLLLDGWPLGRFRRGSAGRLVAEKAPFFLLAAAASWVTYAAQHAEGAVSPFVALPLWARLGNAVTAAVAYLGKALAPVNLAVFYPYPERPLYPPRFLGALAVLALATFLAWRLRRRWPWLALGWWWFAVMLLPVIGIVQVGGQAMADRYSYLPLVGLAAAAAWSAAAIVRARPRLRTAAVILGSVALVAALLATRAQTALWHDSETLFRHALRVTRHNWAAAGSLGSYLAEKGRIDEAVPLYREAIAANPGYDEMYLNLGLAMLEMGRRDEALENFAAAVRVNPRLARAQSMAGLLLKESGEYAAAEGYLRAASLLHPGDHEALNNLAVAVALQGRFGEAGVLFGQALERNPSYAGAHYNWGAVLLEGGRPEEAREHFRRALEIDPGFTPARVVLEELGEAP